ncbi:MAG: TlpA disulfide reductase family protein [Isosphaeraceae bacterium]
MEAAGEYLADGVAEEIKIQLRPRDATPTTVKAARPTTPQPPALGRPAPPLQIIGWTDGKSRSLADYRGKVIFLNFWGIWCSACLNEMPGLERLKQKYEPRGVVFLSIHTPGEEIEKIHRFLDLKKSSLVSALDEDRRQHENSYNGVTADRYGVRGHPTLVMIDRRGNVAFHSGNGTKEGVAAMKALTSKPVCQQTRSRSNTYCPYRLTLSDSMGLMCSRSATSISWSSGWHRAPPVRSPWPGFKNERLGEALVSLELPGRLCGIPLVGNAATDRSTGAVPVPHWELRGNGTVFPSTEP